MSIESMKETIADKVAATLMFLEKRGKLILAALSPVIAAFVVYGIAGCVSRLSELDKRAQAEWPANRMEYADFDGHQYVLLRSMGDPTSCGVTHSPKCKCLQKGEP